MLSRSSAWRAVAAVVAVGVAVSVGVLDTSAEAALPCTVGKITYVINGTTYIADADGTGAKVLVTQSLGGDWSPDGSRYAYKSMGNSGLWSVRADGSAPRLVAAGGPGDRALVSAYQAGRMPSWPHTIYRWPLVGNNAKDTAIEVAKFFFAAPGIAAVATTAGWYDALTGGAMVSFDGGPLLLTDPSGLYAPLQGYLSANSGGMWYAVILGGTAALPAPLQSPIGEAISLPGQWTYHDRTPLLGTGSARTTQAQTQPASSLHATMAIGSVNPERMSPSAVTR